MSEPPKGISLSFQIQFPYRLQRDSSIVFSDFPDLKQLFSVTIKFAYPLPHWLFNPPTSIIVHVPFIIMINRPSLS